MLDVEVFEGNRQHVRTMQIPERHHVGPGNCLKTKSSQVSFNLHVRVSSH